MRKFLVAALATSALGITAPHAYAADSSSFAGGCYGYRDGGDVTQVVGLVAVYSTEAAENPVTATFTCTFVVVNTGASLSFSSQADPVGAMTFGVSYTPQPGDNIQICTTVDYTSNGDSTDTACRPPIDRDQVVSDVDDLVTPVLQVIADLTESLDPTICTVLRTAGVPGVINATTSVVFLALHMDTDDCDLYSLGERLIDFSPYED